MWTPSIIIAVIGLGSVDLSSLITARQYTGKLECELDVRLAVRAMTRVYPTLQVKFAACVNK